jgi:hypothetical protein
LRTRSFGLTFDAARAVNEQRRDGHLHATERPRRRSRWPRRRAEEMHRRHTRVLFGHESRSSAQTPTNRLQTAAISHQLESPRTSIGLGSAVRVAALWGPNPQSPCHAEGRGFESNHPLLLERAAKRQSRSVGLLAPDRGWPLKAVARFATIGIRQLRQAEGGTQ